jgi:predicted RNA-binding Zn ribbon-like protein
MVTSIPGAGVAPVPGVQVGTGTRENVAGWETCTTISYSLPTAGHISPSPAPGEERSVALALVNTELSPRGETTDLLSDGRAVRRWLRAHRLPAPPPASIGEAEIARVRALRTATRAVFAARASGVRAPRSAVAEVNRAAALAPCVERLVWGRNGPRRAATWPPEATPLEIVLARLAGDAIATVLGATGERLRTCEAHGCNRLFIQDHGRRRWCSRTCGDRVRFARHYRRTHPSR